MLSVCRLLRNAPKSLGGTEFLDPIRATLMGAATQRGHTEPCWVTEAQRIEFQLPVREEGEDFKINSMKRSVKVALPVPSMPSVVFTNVSDLQLPPNVDSTILQEFARSKFQQRGESSKKQLSLHKTVVGGYFSASEARVLDEHMKKSFAGGTPLRRLFAKYWVAEHELAVLGWNVREGTEFVELSPNSSLTSKFATASQGPTRVCNAQDVANSIDYSEFFRPNRRIFGLSGRAYPSLLTLAWQAQLMAPVEVGGAGFRKVDVLSKPEFLVGGTLAAFARVHAKTIAHQQLSDDSSHINIPTTTTVVVPSETTTPLVASPPRAPQHGWLCNGIDGTVAFTLVDHSGDIEQLIVAAQTTLTSAAIEAAKESRRKFREKYADRTTVQQAAGQPHI